MNPGFGQTGELTLSSDLNGRAYGLSGIVGYAGSRYWAVGIGVRGAVVAFDGGRVAHSTIDAGLLTSLGLEARFRPAGGGFYLGPSVAFTRLALVGGTNDIGTADNIFEFETQTGPEVALHFGWTKGSFGVDAELGYLHLSSEHGEYRPIAAGVAFVLQHWDVEAE